MLIAPSILNADNLDLKDEIKTAVSAGIRRFHVDIMDGHFVPNLSFGPQLVQDFKQQFPKIKIEIHLMSDRPKTLIPAFVKVGADLLEIHDEAMPQNEVDHWLTYLQAHHLQAGLVLNPDTPIETMKKFLPRMDQLLLMTVHPGFGGQKFLQTSAKRIRQARVLSQQAGKKLPIEVDGGVNDKTARVALNAGANVLVAGSYIFKKGSIVDQIKKLQAVVQ